jgi:hypothetical protein
MTLDVSMTRLTAALLLAMSVFAAEAAFAQAAFVEGGFVIDSRRFSGQPGDRVFDGNVATIMIGGGGFLTPLISASVELDLGAELATAQRVTITIAGRPEVVTTTYASRRRSVSALLGIHSPAQRTMRAGVYAGLAFTAFQQRIAADAPAIVLSAAPPPTGFTHLAATPIIGVDLAAAISRHLAVVAVVRAQGLGFSGELQGFSVRSGAALRASF